MSEKKEYISESSIKESPKKVLNIKLGNGVVKKENMADDSVGLSNLSQDVHQAIASMQVSGIALTGDFGNSEFIGIHQKALTDMKEELEDDIEEIQEAIGGDGSTNTIISRISALEDEVLDDRENTLKSRVGDLEDAVGTGGSVDTRIAAETIRAEAAEGLLQQLYENLTQSDIVVVADHTAVSSPQANTIYREQGTTTYSDWMYYDSSWKKMAEYDNAIDDVPINESNNIVKSNGIYKAINDKSSRQIDFSSLTVYTGDISSEGEWVSYTANGYKGVFVVVYGECEYVLENGSSSDYSHYAFLTDNSMEVGDTPSFAEGVTGRSYISASSAKTVIAPADAKYLFITTEANNAATITSITENYYKQVKEVASDLLDIAKYSANEAEYSTIDYFLKDDGTFGTSTSYKHYQVSVNVGERYILTCPSTASYFTYAFATSDSVTPGNAVPVVSGTSVYKMPAESYKTVVIPTGCNYLLSSSPEIKKVNAVDNSPIKGSDRVVKSDGIFNVTFKESIRGFDLTTLTLTTGDINTNGTWVTTTSSNFKGVFLGIVGGRKYTIANNGTTYNSHYAFLTDNTFAKNTTPSYATGVTGRSVLNHGDSIEVAAPSDANYLFITIMAGDTDMGISITQKIYETVKDIAVDTFSMVMDGAINVGYTIVDYSVLATGKFGGSTNWKHLCAEVKQGEKYLVSAPNRYDLRYAFVTSATATSGGDIPLVNGTSVQTIEANTYKYIEIPTGCSYLLAYKAGVASSGDFTSGVGIKTTKVSEPTDVFPLMTYDYLRYSNGEFSTYNIFANLRYSATPRFIKVNEPFSITSNADGSYLLFYYSSDFSYIGKDTDSNAITANTPQVVTFSYDCSYVKILFTSANEGDTYIPQIKLRGAFPNDWDTFNPRPNDAGYHRISVIVNVTNPTCCDTETSDGTVNDSPQLLPDYGVICLPPTYTNTGTPTRLIIYCHGAAVNYADNVTRFNAQDLEPEYWLAEGYAVMDIEGNPYNNVDEHCQMPQAMDSYVAGYKWAIEHYNLKRDGVFLGGRSMGGGMTISLLRIECPIPVIAACPNAAALNMPLTATAERKEFWATHCGFVLPEGFTFSNGRVSAEKQVFLDNWDKWIKVVPLFTLITNLPIGDSEKQAFADMYWGSDGDARNDYFESRYAFVKCPIKFFGCNQDDKVPYDSLKRWYRMVINSGHIAEIRLFNSYKDYTGSGTSAHHYDTQDPALRADVTTKYGEELESIPVVYIEMLQFWRRYEQSL